MCPDCDVLKTRLAALREALEAITRRVPIMGSRADYRLGQEHALAATADVARAALAADERKE